MFSEAKKAEVIKTMEELHAAVKKLNRLYDDEDLNAVQPDSMSDVLPMSIDEWDLYLDACIQDWRNLPIGEDNDQD